MRETLRPRIVGQPLEKARVRSPSLLMTWDPPVSALEGRTVQRIKYASNETNYRATCQTDGKVLADRALSRLLGDDWPRALEELEQLLDRKNHPSPHRRGEVR